MPNETLFDEPSVALPEDPELIAVRQELMDLDPGGTRFAAAIRRSFDMLLDGQHTGRYRWEQLHKTEKTHCGTLVEINLQREFKFLDGETLDYKIAGIEVDCKFSQDDGKWMIPPEGVGQILLVVWARDVAGRFRAGLIRASEPNLHGGSGNRDSKRSLNKLGQSRVTHIFRDEPLPDNVLLRLSEEDERAIFSHKFGQRRIDELFRRVQRRPISRNAVATVAQQDDYMKRVRGNGGARTNLLPEGIVILGQYEDHRAIAAQLRIPVPGKGESVSVRLALREPRHGLAPSAQISKQDWVVASNDDPVVLAPILPMPKGRGREDL